MVRVSNISPTTGEKVPDSYIHASDAFFRDTKGRAVLLRGVNLSGSAKSPPGQPSQRLEDFWESAESGGQSFVGQPLNLEDGSADIHLRRLQMWGFNCFRYVFTWEALEHEGPGKYDQEFISYTVAVLRKIKEYGFRVFMDPHQDIFSRFTGGSGAPFWVIRACGMNPRNFTVTQASFLHCEWPNPEEPSPIDYPDMLWATNYTRLAAATLSIFFFAGRDFTPKCIIDGKNIQDWLQEHFYNAVRQLAVGIRDAGDLFEDCVIGWDSINEPNKTYLGLTDLGSIPDSWLLRKGPVPTPLQSMRLGAGRKERMQEWVFGPLGAKKAGWVEIDPKGKSIWADAELDEKVGGNKWGWKRDPGWPLGECVWAAHGVWDTATGNLLRPDYFSRSGGPDGANLMDFVAEYWLPHWRGYAAMLRPIHPEAIMFLQPPVFEPPPSELTKDDLRNRAAISAHFYDGLTLITKHWNWFNADAVGMLRGKYPNVLWAVRVGYSAIRKCIRDQLGYLRKDTLDVVGQYPTMIGEIGIPFDLDGKRSYFGDPNGSGKGLGDYSAQQAALDASMNACDGLNVLNYAMWVYCPDNSHVWGDAWNGEDLSIWSLDDVKGGTTLAPPDFPRDHRERELTRGDSRADSQDSDSSSSSQDADATPNGKAPSSVLSRLEETPTFVATPPSMSSEHLTSNPFLTGQLSQGRFTSAHAPLSAASLTNGSRAAPAFCRPYPIATVGSPYEINFEIKSSIFKYTVLVSAEDLEDEKLATEIYVPLIHYAADGLAGAAMGNRFDNGRYSPSSTRIRKRAESSASTKKGSVGSGGSSKAGSTASLPMVVGSAGLRMTASRPNDGGPYVNNVVGDTESSASSATLNVPFSSNHSKVKLLARHGGGGSRTPSANSSSNNLLSPTSQSPPSGPKTTSNAGDAGTSLNPQSLLLDVDVQVTAGTWSVEDQYLSWYIPRDAVGAKGTYKHTITIKRAGGPLPHDQSAGAWELLWENAHACGLC